MVDLREETLYGFSITPESNRLVVSKWVGNCVPADVNTISQRGKGRCTCFGSMRQPYCKHRRMVDRLEKLGLPLMGGFYDYDRDIFYTPEDGEGIPLTGAVDIKQAAYIEGLYY